LARVASLHQKWLRCKPEGALSVECQELNALHSQSVDGAKVVIPDRLSSPPETTEPFILDLLAEAASAFSTRFLESLPVYDMARDLPQDDAMQYIRHLLRGERHAFTEFEMFNMAVAIAKKRGIDLRPMLPYLDLGALTVEQKYIVSSTLGLTPEEDRHVWNSLFWSDILTERDLEQRKLNTKIPLQRFYSSNKSGLRTFWQYLKMGLQDFTRKILVLKVRLLYVRDTRITETGEHRSTTALGSGFSSEEWSHGMKMPQQTRTYTSSFAPSCQARQDRCRPIVLVRPTTDSTSRTI